MSSPTTLVLLARPRAGLVLMDASLYPAALNGYTKARLALDQAGATVACTASTQDVPDTRLVVWQPQDIYEDNARDETTLVARFGQALEAAQGHPVAAQPSAAAALTDFGARAHLVDRLRQRWVWDRTPLAALWPDSPAQLALKWHVVAVGVAAITTGEGPTLGIAAPLDLDDQDKQEVDTLMRTRGYPLHVACQLVGTGLPPLLTLRGPTWVRDLTARAPREARMAQATQGRPPARPQAVTPILETLEMAHACIADDEAACRLWGQFAPDEANWQAHLVRFSTPATGQFRIPREVMSAYGTTDVTLAALAGILRDNAMVDKAQVQ